MISNALAKDTSILTQKVRTQSIIISNQRKIIANDSNIISGQRTQVIRLMNANTELTSSLNKSAFKIKVWRKVAIGFGGIAMFNGIVAYVLAH